MDLHRVDPAAVNLWRLQGVVQSFTTALVLGGGAAVGVRALGLGWALALSAPLAVFVFVFILSLVWPAFSWRALGYARRPHDLLIVQGVLVRRRTSIPLSRIQHVDTVQGPLEQLFGLSRLLVYTASTVSADGVIPGLARQTAEALREELSRRGGDDGV